MDFDVADMIFTHAVELARLARSADFETLAYLLQMVAFEAENQRDLARPGKVK